METSKSCVDKAINHKQSAATPLHIMGIENLEPYFNRFGVSTYLNVRVALGLDLQEVRPIFTGKLNTPIRMCGGKLRPAKVVPG